ncbi:MAG: hypothetical protein AB8B64_23875 [Granulosicoccus sp.]
MPLPRPSTVRVSLLLTVLAIVGFISLHQSVYTRSWTKTLQVTVFPINGDGHQSTDNYVKALTDESFSAINHWGIREAKRHDLDLQTPFEVTLGEQIMTMPPFFPDNTQALAVVLWGLRFRYWAWKNTPDGHEGLTRVRMFVVYQGNDETPLQHSLGMQKGLMGLVHAYALETQTAQNNIVIAHEMLHTVGATDKYGSHGAPLYPQGYANILHKPLHPQRRAEIMAGRIPTSSNSSYMAYSLRSVVINETTASEINWLP